MALREDLGEGEPPWRCLAGPLQDLESEPMESLDEDARGRPVSSDRRGSMSPQAARRHYDANGESKKGGIPPGRVEKPSQVSQDGSFGGESAARDEDPPRRRRRSRRALRLEKAELDCHGARISRKTRLLPHQRRLLLGAPGTIRQPKDNGAKGRQDKQRRP
jgi:hypothetical protein